MTTPLSLQPFSYCGGNFYGDVVYAQTWQVLTLKKSIEPFSYTSTANFVASALVSVRLLCKHLSNLQNFFWQMVNSEVSDGSQRKNAKQVASKKNLKSGNLVLKMQVYQKKLVEKEHFCIKPKLLRQQDLSMVLLIVVIWKLKFLMN